MTPHAADAATLRGIGERLQARGDDGVAALVFYAAELVEDCVDVPLDLVTDTVSAIKESREK